MDPPERARELARKLGLGYPLLADPERQVIRAFGVEDAENGIAWPAIFLLDGERKVLWRALAETVQVRPPSALVLEALDASRR